MAEGSAQRMLSTILAVVLTALVCASASAQSGSTDPLNLGVIGNDDRKPMDSDLEPWNAIGKVYKSKIYRQSLRECTGTLVDPEIVVTAAHCLTDQSGSPIPASDIHFLAGYRLEKYIAHSVGKCVLFSPYYEHGSEVNLSNTPEDFAFVVLENAIDTPSVLFYDKREIEKQDKLVHAGYGSDRLHLLSVHEGCSAEYYKRNVYFTDCDTHPGQSGGPIFIKKNEKHYIVAVMSSGSIIPTSKGEKQFNFATSILRFRHSFSKIKNCPSSNEMEQLLAD